MFRPHDDSEPAETWLAWWVSTRVVLVLLVPLVAVAQEVEVPWPEVVPADLEPRRPEVVPVGSWQPMVFPSDQRPPPRLPPPPPLGTACSGGVPDDMD